MRIYTRTGDGGDTGLLGSARVPKDHVRIAAYGDVDELNAQIGVLAGSISDPEVGAVLRRVQELLLECGAELARPPGTPPVAAGLIEEDVLYLEGAIDRLDATLPALDRFVLPRGNDPSCAAHVARCVCRRSERSVVRLLREEPSSTHVLPFLNRLSDYLFVVARWANRTGGIDDTPWQPRGTRGRGDRSGEPGPTSG